MVTTLQLYYRARLKNLELKKDIFKSDEISIIHLNNYLHNLILVDFYRNHIYQPLRSGRIWHKVNF